MAGLAFCLNRRLGTTSTAIVFGEEVQPGFRVQIREKRVYGQIWEGIVDGNQICGEGAFVELRAILNLPAPCPGEDGYQRDPYDHCERPVASEDPNIVTIIDDPVGPIEDPVVDPPMMDCSPEASYGGDPCVEVIIADYNGYPVSCNECEAMLFP